MEQLRAFNQLNNLLVFNKSTTVLYSQLFSELQLSKFYNIAPKKEKLETMDKVQKSEDFHIASALKQVKFGGAEWDEID